MDIDSQNEDTAAIADSVARSGWRFPAQKLTKTHPLQQKTAQNINCQNNGIDWHAIKVDKKHFCLLKKNNDDKIKLR